METSIKQKLQRLTKQAAPLQKSRSNLTFCKVQHFPSPRGPRRVLQNATAFRQMNSVAPSTAHDIQLNIVHLNMEMTSVLLCQKQTYFVIYPKCSSNNDWTLLISSSILNKKGSSGYCSRFLDFHLFDDVEM